MERQDFFTLKNGDKAKLPFTEKEYQRRKDNLRNIGLVKYKTYLYDPDLVAKTTVKETTIDNIHHTNVAF